MRNSISLIASIIMVLITQAYPGDYYTTGILEPDRIGTAWMISKFVDTTAVFHFVERDSIIKGATPFDTPSARYRRYPRYSTTMSVVRIHKIKDQKALKLAKIIDEIELDFWGADKSEKARKVKADLMKIVEENKDLYLALERAFEYINAAIDTF